MACSGVHSHVCQPYPNTMRWATSRLWKNSSGWKKVWQASALTARNSTSSAKRRASRMCPKLCLLHGHEAAVELAWWREAQDSKRWNTQKRDQAGDPCSCSQELVLTSWLNHSNQLSTPLDESTETQNYCCKRHACKAGITKTYSDVVASSSIVGTTFDKNLRKTRRSERQPSATLSGLAVHRATTHTDRLEDLRHHLLAELQVVMRSSLLPLPSSRRS